MRATGPGQSSLLLLDVVELLNSEKIEYAVVGAMAASIHGVVRASFDADAVLRVTVQRAADLERKLVQSGFQCQLNRGDFSDPIPALLSLADPFRNRVDLLIGLRGLEAEAFSRAISIPFQGTTLCVIGREDFIAMKVFAGGPQDLADARATLAAAGPLDMELLRRLADRYGKDASAALDKLLADGSR